MEWLFIFALIAALAGLLGRLKTAERRIELIEADQALLLEKLRGADRSPVAEVPHEPEPEPLVEDPMRPRASVPKVAALHQRPEDAEHSARLDPAQHETDAAILDAKSGRAPFRLDLEDIFGRRLPIWAGGIALAVAGVFLVRYSIERGLITPLLRVVMAFLFGFALLAGAEATYRFRERVADPRVGQALAGAGLATLYAAFYLAGTQYGLIGQTLAFLGLAAVTAGAIALSFRFGLPSAVLGLVGGFAAPALVGGEEANLPLLSLYLGLVTAGLVASGRRQERPWMGMAALAGALGWGAVLLLAGDFGLAEAGALGLYLVLLGAVLPALTAGQAFERPLRLAAALLASVQLALLVDQAGYSPLVWGLYLLLGAALAFFGWRRPDIREGNAIAAAVALVLLAQWQGASATSFALVAAGIAAVFALVPLALAWQGADRDVDVWQIAGAAVGLAAVSYASFGNFSADRPEAVLALATLALAALPGIGAWLMRRRGAPAPDFAVQLMAATALIFAAMLMMTPGWAAPLAGATVFAGLLALLKDRAEAPLQALIRAAAVIVLIALASHVRVDEEVRHLFGAGQDSRGFLPFVRWLAVAAVFAALAWRERSRELLMVAEGAAALFAYGALAQVLPRELLAWAAALLAIGIHFALRNRRAARGVALGIGAAWALEPLGQWLWAGLASLGADPVFVSELPGPPALATYVLPLLAALVVVKPALPDRIASRMPGAALALPVALVVAHVGFKQVFALDSATQFVRMGLAERTLWEAMLLAGAWLACFGLPRIGTQRGVARALAGAALAHFGLYTALLHNPLWAAQALGPVPLANWGTAGYGIAIAAVLSLRRWSTLRLRPAIDGATMVLACFAALTVLRHAFVGSLPVFTPMSQTEDLLRSLAGILLALGFLWLGSVRGERSWRVGSLAIMLLAVAKVFLVDAAGLDGLLRVASFMALGFSLIGIGWVYSRQLRLKPAQ